jgi:hypothetical protein
LPGANQIDGLLISPAEAAALLGDAATSDLSAAGCSAAVLMGRGTPTVFAKYSHYDRVEFEPCAEHAAKTALAYSHRGGAWEEVTYPCQSQAWIKPVPRVR